MGIAEIFGLRPAGETYAASALYGSIVAQARDPRFFSAHGVPDTLDGHFETLALHVFLLLHRLKSDASAASELARALVEVFVADMDRTLREMGAADLGVGRRVKEMTQALYGRIKVYEAGLDQSDNVALEAALRRNLYGTLDMPRPADVAAVARYVRCQHTALAAQPISELRAGRVGFAPLADPAGPEARP
jgi:cytochrome b pre-mRNA-processing protein 3